MEENLQKLKVLCTNLGIESDVCHLTDMPEYFQVFIMDESKASITDRQKSFVISLLKRQGFKECTLRIYNHDTGDYDLKVVPIEDASINPSQSILFDVRGREHSIRYGHDGAIAVDIKILDNF